MDATTALIWAAGAAVAGLAGIVLVTSKWIPPKHLFPTLAVYFAVAASIAISLASPRLTSTTINEATVGGGLAGDIARVAAVVSACVGLAAFLLSIRRGWRLPALAGAFITYGVVGFVSALLNGQPFELGMVYVYALVGGVALTATWTFSEATAIVRRCLRAYLWLSLGLIFVAPAMAFWDVQGRELFGVKQLAGVTTHPNGLGTVAAVAIFAEMLKPQGLRRPNRIHLLAAVAVLVLTQSRGAWLAVGVGLLFWLVGRAKGATLGFMVPLVAAVTLASLAFTDQILGWLEGTTDQRDFSTLNGRTLIWEQTLAPLADSPWLGYGPLVFDARFRWQALGLSDGASHSNSHNQVIQTLVERGWIGLAVLAIFVILLLRTAWRQPLKLRGPVLAIAMIFVSRFAVETPLYISTASLNAAVLVLLLALFTAKPDQAEMPEAVTRLSTPKKVRLSSSR